jgi:hypothetical protein
MTGKLTHWLELDRYMRARYGIPAHAIHLSPAEATEVGAEKGAALSKRAGYD